MYTPTESVPHFQFAYKWNNHGSQKPVIWFDRGPFFFGFLIVTPLSSQTALEKQEKQGIHGKSLVKYWPGLTWPTCNSTRLDLQRTLSTSWRRLLTYAYFRHICVHNRPPFAKHRSVVVIYYVLGVVYTAMRYGQTFKRNDTSRSPTCARTPYPSWFIGFNDPSKLSKSGLTEWKQEIHVMAKVKHFAVTWLKFKPANNTSAKENHSDPEEGWPLICVRATSPPTIPRKCCGLGNLQFQFHSPVVASILMHLECAMTLLTGNYPHVGSISTPTNAFWLR